MKRFILLSIICIILVSCKKNVSSVNQLNISTIDSINGFELNGKLENFYPKKVYLNKIIENSIYPIDSSEVINNRFTFKGIVEFPERYSLTFENYSLIVICIIENAHIDILFNSNNIIDPIINGSTANNLFNQYKVQSKQIFKKIDYLYPQFQKARLENNVDNLTEIRDKMRKIEIEYRDFSYNFIIQNKNSYVAAMILRDQLKSPDIDTLRVKNTYQILSKEIKNSPDSKIIKSFLELY